MYFTCDAVDQTFAQRAPLRFENIATIDAAPQEVFAQLRDNAAWPKWFPTIQHAQWTSDKTACAGATRRATLASVAIDEYFLEWVENERIVFRFSGMTKPLFRAGLEEYLLAPLPDGKTQFTYRVYIAMRGPLGLFAGTARKSLAPAFEDAAKGLQAHFAKP